MTQPNVVNASVLTADPRAREDDRDAAMRTLIREFGRDAVAASLARAY